MSYTPIRCDLYDYVEIACMRGYNIEVVLLSNEVIHGIAKTTRIENKEEFIILENDKKQLSIRLDKIKDITALDDNAEFETIRINQPK